MAAADYAIRGGGSIASMVSLSVGVGPGQTLFKISYAGTVLNVIPAVGMAILIEREICVITGTDTGEFTVARGCADTVPANHPAGALIWLIDDVIGTDQREYLAGDTLGVKLLMRTAMKEMTIQSSPPHELVMTRRFARPYPPGKVLVNGDPFYQEQTLDYTHQSLELSWAHRDRVVQSDQLYGHQVDSIGPEPGTTYVLRVFDGDSVFKRVITGIVGTAISYTFDSAISDLGLSPSVDLDVPGILILQSSREGFRSRQAYVIKFVANAGDVPVGWGSNWGYNWGSGA